MKFMFFEVYLIFSHFKAIWHDGAGGNCAERSCANKLVELVFRQCSSLKVDGEVSAIKGAHEFVEILVARVHGEEACIAFFQGGNVAWR